MTNKKNTRRALFSSVISLILCFSMLVGTTFAWFTDSVTSGINTITAGNLDVELYHSDKNDSGYVNAETKLFNDVTLWEPGVVAYENFVVENKGNLALKYQLSINFANETVVNGHGLSEALQVAVVEGGFTGNRAAAQQLTNLVPLSSFVLSGELEGDTTSKTYGIVIYWEPTDNDNLFNMNNDLKGNTLTIDLGINLFATQEMYESDSFGDDYDEDAIYTDAVVTNEEELKVALANAEDGDIIGIKGNVTWTTGASSGSTPFAEEGTLKNITLLGLENGATFTAIGSGVGAVGIDGGTVTFKNLKIVDKSVSYAEDSWEFGYLEFRGNTVFENCNVVNAIMMEGDSAKFVNCTFNSNDDNQYAVWVANGNATFENCTVTGARGLKIHEDYGSEVGTVVINNNTFVELTKKPGLAIGTVNAGTTVVLTNNEFIGTQPGDDGNYKYETDTDVTTFKFTDEGNKVVAQDATLPDGLYQIDDTTWKATNTNALATGLDKAEEGDTIVLGQDMTYTGRDYLNLTKDVTIDLNGNTLSTTSLGVVAKAGTIKNGTIANPVGERAALRTWSGVSVENVTIESPENGGITVAQWNTLPSIKNVTINAKTYGIELQYGATVETIENVNIVAGENGIVAMAATIGNISNVVIDAENAGIWGQLKGTANLNITVDGTNEIVGGNYGIYLCDEGATIVPDGVAKLTYADASNFEGGVKDMEFAFGQSGKLVINGAKVGAFISNAEELFAFAKSVNEDGNSYEGMTVYLTAEINLENKAWTPIGQTGATEFRGIFDGQNHTISNLYIDSSEQTGANYSSGLFGWAESHVTIQNVNIDGATVTGNHNVAALVGYTYSAKITNCHVSNATIVCKHANSDACGDKAGLIAGYAADEASITNCSASNSTVTAGRDAGQLIGCGYTASVSGCSATNVTVTATGDCAKEGNINNNLIGRVMG